MKSIGFSSGGVAVHHRIYTNNIRLQLTVTGCPGWGEVVYMTVIYPIITSYRLPPASGIIRSYGGYPRGIIYGDLSYAQVPRICTTAVTVWFLPAQLSTTG